MARVVVVLGVLAGLGAAASAVARTAKPDWIATPTAEEICRAYPDEARRQGIEGAAILVCEVTADDTLDNCFLQKETPAGSHFGEAAMGLVGRFVLRPDSWPFGVPVELPVRFKMQCDPAAGRAP